MRTSGSGVQAELTASVPGATDRVRLHADIREHLDWEETRTLGSETVSWEMERME